MDFLNLPKHEAIIRNADKRSGVDSNAVETLLTLQDALQQLNGGIEDFLTRFGLSQGKFTVLLLLLEEKDGFQPSELAKMAGVTRATITGLLDGLERDGLIKRVKDRGDKRTMTIKLTPVAVGMMEAVLTEYYRRIGKWLGGVSGGGRRTLIGVLSMILDKMHEDDKA